MIETPLENDVLNELAYAADETADAIVVDVAKSFHKNPGDMDWDKRREVFPELMRMVGRDEEPFGKFVRGGAKIDRKIKPELVHHAQGFFEEHGVAVITALFLASLPQAYLGRRGVQVLDLTGELVSNWSRRIQETGQFLINVLTGDPSSPEDGKTNLHHGEFGARVVRRVRLTHAAVRWLLMAPYNPKHILLFREDLEGPKTVWRLRMNQIGEVGKDGKLSAPLSQEDLLGTLGTFTTVVFQALQKLAVTYDEQDREAFYHLWNVVGWHLGIGDSEALRDVTTGIKRRSWPGNEILPLRAQEMDALFERLRQRLEGESEEGRRLAKTLVQDFSYPLPRQIQGAPAFVVRYLIGDNRANMLDIDAGGYAELLVRRTRVLEMLAKRTRATFVGELMLSAVSQMFTRYALRLFVARSRESERGLTIDPHTASRWGIQTGPELWIREPSAARR
jgi:hypothetical protein